MFELKKISGTVQIEDRLNSSSATSDVVNYFSRDFFKYFEESQNVEVTMLVKTSKGNFGFKFHLFGNQDRTEWFLTVDTIDGLSLGTKAGNQTGLHKITVVDHMRKFVRDFFEENGIK